MNKINIIELEKTCSMCPAQWEGKTDDNRTVYIRERHSFLTVQISKVGGGLDNAFDYPPIIAIDTDTAGGLTFGELYEFTKDRLNFSKQIIKEQGQFDIRQVESFMKVFNTFGSEEE